MMTTLLFLLLLRIYQIPAHHRASLKTSPNKSQYFEYDRISFSCEQTDSGEWTVWRYTTDSLTRVLSQCGSGWGHQTSSSCHIQTLKQHYTGVYWCESKQRDSSNVINITVIKGQSAILKSPVLPVMEGDDITLYCIQRNTSNLQAKFFKNDFLIKNTSPDHMTIHNFSKSDEAAYRCHYRGHEESPVSWLLMEDDSDPVLLTASPDSSQLFEYDNLLLTCSNNSGVHRWKVVRATTSGKEMKLETCGETWGNPSNSSCFLPTAKKSDSAIYWCESPSRQRSNSVSITVYDQPVILQSPVLPVMEGDDVTLRCHTKTPPSNLTTGFYRDGSLISTEPTGHMTIRHVSRSDEGLYKCHISNIGESPSSWLFVRDPPPPPTADANLSMWMVIRHLVVCVPYFISTFLMVSLYHPKCTGKKRPQSTPMSRRRADDEGSDQQYDDVIADVTTEHQF